MLFALKPQNINMTHTETHTEPKRTQEIEHKKMNIPKLNIYIHFCSNQKVKLLSYKL